MTEEKELFHYGTLHKSGRFPYGSGQNPNQRNRQFLTYVDDLKKQGLTDSEIAKGLGITRVQLQANRVIAKSAEKQDQINTVVKLKEKGMSNVAIGEQLGINESSVRALLTASTKDTSHQLKVTSDMLKDNVDNRGMLDIGTGVENHLGISKEKLAQAVAVLREDGYEVFNFQVEQVNTGKKTNMKVLAPPGTPYKDVYQKQDQIQSIASFSEDGGRSFAAIQKPLSVDSKRVGVRYAEDGGADMDGVIQVRRGVDDVSLGGSKYAQVRIAVDGTHYLKGMAVYSDDLPKGVDLMFNTNKTSTGNKLDAMKPMADKKTGKIDESNPFGAVVRQQFKKDEHGNDILDSKGNRKLASALNIVNEEGAWDKWSPSISSQALSKQSPALAKQQLALKLDAKRSEFDEIMQLTNPTVKKKLLASLSDDLDSSAVHLKAAALPRQRTQVILPINSLKDTEIYAPNFKSGEKVVLIRYPHGGIFEIPELTVNNRNAQAKTVMGGAKDAVGINAKVASRLSGADFDGDTVLVIPNNNRAMKSGSPLKELKDFDPQKLYPKYDGMKPMTSRTTQLKMGDISNLITDMTLKGAPPNELSRAVRHSMVVIDAEKHKLNWQQSAKDHGISELKKKYQGASNAGASTLISRASSQARVPKRKQWSPSNRSIDPVTGKRIFTEADDASYTDSRTGKTVKRLEKSTKMFEADDAFTLSSGRPMENIYAAHANSLKSMANKARKEWLATPSQKYSPSSKIAYRKEVETLDAKLNTALMNAPLERKAQLIANTVVKAKMQAKPDMDSAEIKKLKSLALIEARNRTGAGKKRIDVTPSEWAAIQAGAISNNKLTQILDNMRDEDIKALATPRDRPTMIPSKIARAQNLLNADYTRAEVAEALGVSVTTLNTALSAE